MKNSGEILNSTMQLETADLNDPRLAKEQLKLLYSNSILLDVATIILVVFLALEFRFLFDPVKLYSLCGFLIITSLFRMVFRVLFRKSGNSAKTNSSWKTIYIISSMLLALGCGGSSFLFYSQVEISSLILFCFIVSAYCAVALMALSPVYTLSISFVAVSFLPVAWHLIQMPTHESVVLGLAVTSFFIAMFLLANQNNKFVLSLVSLGFQNNALIADLTKSKNFIEEKNRKLNFEVTEHKKTETELRKAMEDAEEAARIKSEFLATMSHEIRTPMNGVLGMTELLMNTRLTGKQSRFAETIRQSGEALLSIINDILDFSKIEAGKFDLKKDTFDLRQLLEDTTALFGERAHKKNVELVCNFPVNAHTAFHHDSSRIRQVLNNLIGNAVKFTEQGEVVISTRLEQETDSGALIYIEVKDTGIGIREEAQDRIFDSFTQADGSMTRHFGGTGLGLAICKKLLELMDGEIGVFSEPGKGSSFWFKLTMAKEDSKNVRNPKSEVNANLNGVNVLIVDANSTCREILGTQLGGYGACIEEAKTAKEAMHKLLMAQDEGKPFDIVILDKMLPSMDGIQLAKKIKANQIIAATRVIILSSVGQLEQTGEWMMAGVEAYLNKPLRQTELFNCLCRITDKIKNGDQNSDHEKQNNVIRAPINRKLSGYVLVAEDNLINQELITSMLENYGVRFRFVGDGQEAIDAYTGAPLDQLNDPYQLILMDCQMPQVDGFEATRAIREWESSQQQTSIPIIALTANAMPGDRERCIEAGMDDYLSKPFTNDQFFTMLKKWMPVLKEDITNHSEVKDEKLEATPACGHVANLDEEALDRVRQLQREGSADVLLKIIDIYLQKSPELLQQIEEAVSKGEPDKLRHAAHSLKSSSASLGASRLSKLCSELEQIGKSGETHSAMVKLDILEFEFEAVSKALQIEYEKQAA